MIRSVIHYCWFGRKPLPDLAQRCVASWRQHMPQCEVRRWDEDNFDVHAVPYTAEAYRLGKYAFVSDYARLWILYHHGGIYLDTDVELLKPLDDMLEQGPFMGQEQPEDPSDRALHCAMGLGMACQAGHPFVARMLQHYQSAHFVTWTGQQGATIVDTVRQLMADEPIEPVGDGIVRAAGFNIYPWPWLCPMNYFTGELKLQPQSHAIHHYAASWVDDIDRQTLLQKFGRRLRAAAVRLRSL